MFVPRKDPAAFQRGWSLERVLIGTKTSERILLRCFGVLIYLREVLSRLFRLAFRASSSFFLAR